MKRTLISLLIIPLMLIAVGIESRNVSADVNYDWEYNATNIYSNGALVYEFSGLDTSASRQWTIWTADTSTGLPDQYLGFRALGPGSATGTWQVGTPSAFDFNQVLWPDDFTGPILVRDQNGTIIGRHFVAQHPSTAGSNDWLSSNGNVPFEQKLVIGNTEHSGECASPVYDPVNADGWHHNETPCSVITIEDGYALLHFQIPVTYTSPTDIEWNIYSMPSGTSPLLTIDEDDLASYMVTSGYSFGFTATAAYSFVILNTSGSPLPFVNNAWAASNFTTGDNPLLAEFDPGAYSYNRTDADTFTNAGESIWLVSEDVDGREWDIEVGLPDLAETGSQTYTVTAVTSEIWDAYSGAQSVVDSEMGVIDATLYSFVTSRSDSFAVGVPASNVTLIWTHTPSAINAGISPVDVDEMTFSVSDTYSIIDNVTLEESLNEVLGNTGLNNDLGKNSLFMVVLALGLMSVAALPVLRSQVVAYLIVWTCIGAGIILSGFSTDLASIMFVLITLVLWVMVFTGAVPIMSEDEG